MPWVFLWGSEIEVGKQGGRAGEKSGNAFPSDCLLERWHGLYLTIRGRKSCAALRGNKRIEESVLLKY